jgi:hypothetical protein
MLCFLAFVVTFVLTRTITRRRYHGNRLQRATRRAADFDRRWAPLQTDWEDFVGGKPSQPNPPASDDVHR